MPYALSPIGVWENAEVAADGVVVALAAHVQRRVRLLGQENSEQRGTDALAVEKHLAGGIALGIDVVRGQLANALPLDDKECAERA